MQLSAIDSSSASLPAAAFTPRDRFTQMLAQMQANPSAGPKDAELAQTDDAREAAQQLIATTLVMPILSQARKDPFRSEMFHGGFGEDAFGAQLDTVLADRIAAGPQMQPLVDSVYRQLTQAGRKAQVNLNG